MIRHFRSLVYLTVFSITLNLQAAGENPTAAAGDPAKGKSLFDKNNCGSCHNLDKKVVGPALRGVSGRRSAEWLTKWIKNSQDLVKSGDADANSVFNEYGKVAMPAFTNLSDADIKDIIAYTDTKKVVDKGPVVTVDNKATEENNTAATYVVLSLLLVFVIVLLVLSKIQKTLKKLAAEQNPEEFGTTDAPWYTKLLPGRLASMNPVVLSLFSTAIVGLVGFVWWYGWAMREIGVQKGYAPKQPIAYSHKKHAGDLKIDCKYCHVGVEVSKSATIPSLNICMNCHKGVQKASEGQENIDISPEIQKIYTALDYHPEKSGAEQWGPNPRPVQWVRIHNLPDHAYFNHSQHVKVGKLACQTCHGPIEKMEVVQQWSTLQMGWCIDCHRNTGIDVANNNYYKALHEKASADMKKNNDKSKYFSPNGKLRVTVAQNGGLECAKCHY